MALPRSIRVAIANFDRAAQNFAFKGAAHPDDRYSIQHQYDQAKGRLEREIEKAIQK